MNKDDGARTELIEHLRKGIQSMNKDFPILKEGEGNAIELDPNNPSHVDWYKGV